MNGTAPARSPSTLLTPLPSTALLSRRSNVPANSRVAVCRAPAGAANVLASRVLSRPCLAAGFPAAPTCHQVLPSQTGTRRSGAVTRT